MAPIISATMAPNDQMSIGVEYLAQPSRISGALVKEGVELTVERKRKRTEDKWSQNFQKQ